MSTPKQALKSLTLAVLPKIEVNPVQERRTKTIARLEEQKLLFANPSRFPQLLSFCGQTRAPS